MKLKGHPKEIAEELAKLSPELRISVIEAAVGDHAVCRKMLEATGRMPRPATAGESGRPRYVVGTPPVPVTTGIQQPLMDSIIIHEDGTFFGSARADAFVDNKYWPDHTLKTSADTNMMQCGQLGYPCEFTLRSLGLRVVDYTDPRDVRAVLSELAVTWFFGCNTPWLRLPASAWKPVVAFNESVLSLLGSDLKLEAYKAAVLSALETRDAWPAYQHNIAPIMPGDTARKYGLITEDGARHISSTESFRAQFELVRKPKLRGRVKFALLMQDTLYAQL